MPKFKSNENNTKRRTLKGGKRQVDAAQIKKKKVSSKVMLYINRSLIHVIIRQPC